MATAYEVAQYIEAQMSSFGETQRHKLAYYAQAWHLVWTGRPLFADRIEAWKNGPVVRSLRFVHPSADSSTLTDDERATVDAVLDYYGHMNGGSLSALTHKEAPWLDTRGELPRGAACDDEIPLDLMRQYYSAKSASGKNVPKRTVRAQTVADDAVLTLASANAKRWEKTLRLLAE